jgi:hypothetical protein
VQCKRLKPLRCNLPPLPDGRAGRTRKEWKMQARLGAVVLGAALATVAGCASNV